MILEETRFNLDPDRKMELLRADWEQAKYIAKLSLIKNPNAAEEIKKHWQEIASGIVPDRVKLVDK